MRIVQAQEITTAVKELCIQTNYILPTDLEERLHHCKKIEASPLAKEILGDLAENLRCAKELQVPICQDTGMAVVFVEVGQDVHIEGSLEEAIHEGVRQGYLEGKLRCSVVKDPLRRVNTEDNTPAIIHYKPICGEQIHITVAPKGFGSENMSGLKMFTPAATTEDLIAYVTDHIAKAGSNPCPPMVVGIGIGGDFEYVAYLAKKALCRPVSRPNPDPFYREMEQEILERINRLDIGPQGFGGTTTALAVHIEAYPTHIAGLPVAINVGCHVTRHGEVTI